jgi:hypothetical protein
MHSRKHGDALVSHRVALPAIASFSDVISEVQAMWLDSQYQQKR